MSSKKIFISHRSVDADIVKELVQFMENVGIDSEIIMFTSADYTNAKNELAPEIKKALTESSVIIVVISKEYFESVYCCNELGYIWATDNKPIVFGLTNIDSPKDLEGFVNDWVIKKVNNVKHLASLYDKIYEFSKYDYIPNEKVTEYIFRCVDNINRIIEKKAVNRPVQQKSVYSPTKVIDIDSLIKSKYYGDKELLLFKYLMETNDYIWGITENLRSKIQDREKMNRLKAFLSYNLESFLVMLVHKGYVNCKIISRKEWALQGAVGKTDDWSKQKMAIFGANEKGETEHNYFEIKEPFYRAIIMCNQESIDITNNCVKKYRLKWYQKYNTK